MLRSNPCCRIYFMAPFSLNDKVQITVAIPMIIISIIIRPGIAGAGGGP